MAINVDKVYKTVLLILNQQQRGYITPDEFNKTATQVQLDIFEQYFRDINRQLQVPQADIDYSDMQLSIDEKISIFKTEGDCVLASGKWNLPIVDTSGNTVIYNYDSGNIGVNEVAFYSLGTVLYSPSVGLPIELQRLQKIEFYNLERSDLTASTENFPTYLYENLKLTVQPSSITTGMSAAFLRKPKSVFWGYSVGSLGQYNWDYGTSQNFELLESEQIDVIIRILKYSGIIIGDPQIVQAASNELQQMK
jgi:hypothetical protein